MNSKADIQNVHFCPEKGTFISKTELFDMNGMNDKDIPL